MPTSTAHTELNISLDEVRRLPRVDPMSDVIGDNFALVAKEDSLACRKTRELGPYDVINLDCATDLVRRHRVHLTKHITTQ